MTSRVAESWGRIVKWLQTNSTSNSVVPFPLTTQSHIDAFQTCTEIRLPQQLLDLYSVLHIMGASSAFPSNDDCDQMAFTPMPLSEVHSEWTSQKELVDIGQFDDCNPMSDPGVANVWWAPGWIPFASNGGGDFLCIDNSPTDSGVVGQIISHSHETGKHGLLSTSLESFLDELATAVEAGSFAFDDRFGLIPDQVKSLEASGDPREELPSSETTEWRLQRSLQLGEEAFKKKDYAKCVLHLSRIEERLEKLPASRLAFARKKLREPE